ncbi:MAG: 2,3-bisphosphoglycerate-independent phosphoglycerate mutase [candidate division TM6 bacterium GW2011_GWF2_28_16]|nr:MAG: 2,3-bisphosphoglycerate-independent phosphoglycerate mutase [candidate division TM6 bacterium GW2011_GWF2_28_16]
MNKITTKNPVFLVILDGFGYKSQKKGNAIANAKMPFWQFLLKNYPSTLLAASGKAVGLLPNFMGNSEVGHLTIGAGRVIKSILAQFKESINNKSLLKNKILISNLKKLKDNNKNLHIIGLLSDGGVHSHEFQLHALLEIANKQNIKNIYVHAILDGRDVPPESASKYLQNLDNYIKKNKLKNIKLASIHGRYYAMDRDNNWYRTEKSYNILCNPNIKKINFKNWENLINFSYKKNITDEFIEPTLLINQGQIKTGDGVIFYNFRPDRARQLTQAFIDPKFNEFKTQDLNSTNKTLSFFITTVRYNNNFKKFNNIILFKQEDIKNTLIDELSKNNLKIFAIAETEKYAHVTYFFRGMHETKLPNEEFLLIPSIKAKSYIKHPEMSANKITEKILESLNNDPKNFYLVNYANADMVGHSGNFNATVKACECLDKQLKILYQEIVTKHDGTLFITADHGNAEEMLDKKTGQIKTAHTLNPVVFMEISPKNKNNIEKAPKYPNTKFGPKFGLCNIAPTILSYFKFKIPQKMAKKTIIL